MKNILFIIFLAFCWATTAIAQKAHTDIDYGLEMVYVEGGTFNMGCTSEQRDCRADEYPVHAVTLSSFYIGKYEVTYAQWRAVMGYNPLNFSGCDQCPAVMLSPNDVREFILKINKLTRKKYRIPTEAEWEYAARGGNKSKGYQYSGSDTLSLVASCDDTKSFDVYVVGSKRPNELGIYDMSGNAWEVCSDLYLAEYYKSSPSINPTGPSHPTYMVIRGGGVCNVAACRVASRYYTPPPMASFSQGFRLSLDSDTPAPIPTPTPAPAPTPIPTPTPAPILIPGQPIPLSIDNNYDMEMVYVEGGTFNMGCTSEQRDCYESEKPAHTVSLSSFYIGKYEVTQEQWRAVMGNNPSSNWGCDRCPVAGIRWDDAQEFISKLNQLTGKRYRLPTEAEWEYAARGGNRSKGYEYSGSNDIRLVAWYSDNSDTETHPVGRKRPNELGIYDMTGNVYEWCNDWYDEDYYKKSPKNNPQGPSNGTRRVMRGGVYNFFPKFCRIALRSYFTPSDPAGGDYGFRLVLEP